MTDNKEIPEAKSLRWVCNQIPDNLGDSNEERMLKAIKEYCKRGADKIEELANHRKQSDTIKEFTNKICLIECEMFQKAHEVQNSCNAKLNENKEDGIIRNRIWGEYRECDGKMIALQDLMTKIEDLAREYEIHERLLNMKPILPEARLYDCIRFIYGGCFAKIIGDIDKAKPCEVEECFKKEDKE